MRKAKWERGERERERGRERGEVCKGGEERINQGTSERGIVCVCSE